MTAPERLVPDDRLRRAWEVVASRVPTLWDATPDAWIQAERMQHLDDAADRKVPALAVFTLTEQNPRYPLFLQVSSVTCHLDEWQKDEIDRGHFVSGRDHLVGKLAILAKGHMKVMSDIRSMSHPVMKYDGEGKGTPVL